MNEAQQQAWRDFQQLFIAAFDNPIARRRHQDEYAVEAREAFHRLRRLLEPNELSVPGLSEFLVRNGIPSTDTVAAAVGGIASTLMPNQNWAQEAVSNGMAVTDASTVQLIGDTEYFTGISNEFRERLLSKHTDAIDNGDHAIREVSANALLPEAAQVAIDGYMQAAGVDVDRMTHLIATDPKMK